MALTPAAIAELNKPLSSSAVKERTQGGRKVSYVEGWHAIAEANRIFGFDAWTRETDEIRCVSERERQLGSGKQGWGVTYVCRVRVRVGNVLREGCGAGHGIDQDLGQAHESAIKEAETDAMKRALMTFGNPFGLALYDKTQSNVSDERPLISDQQRDQLGAVITAAGIELKTILNFYGIANLKEMPADKFTDAKARLDAEMAKRRPKAA
jgi:DNA repair and recombination protein RAD52